jgi:hypothetical protein
VSKELAAHKYIEGVGDTYVVEFFKRVFKRVYKELAAHTNTMKG